MPTVEQIPDEDTVSRHVEQPRTFNAIEQKVLLPIFEFPRDGGERESLVWRKYAPLDTDVHALGCEWEAEKRKRKPEMRYVGFISALVAAIRNFRTVRGHGLEVRHGPCEGIHHADVRYHPAANVEFSKHDKAELKFGLLNRIFGPRTPHSCAGDAVGQ